MTDAKVSTVTPHKQMPVKEMLFFLTLIKSPLSQLSSFKAALIDDSPSGKTTVP